MQERTADDVAGEVTEERLPGGGVGGAVRVGDTVRRPVGDWTPTVHALLTHLSEAGLEGVPRPHGYDEVTVPDERSPSGTVTVRREILDFIPGDCAEFYDPWPAWAYGDELIVAAMRWLARFHRVVASFRPDGPLRWRSGVRAIADDEIVCHNDFAPYNLIVQHDPHPTPDLRPLDGSTTPLAPSSSAPLKLVGVIDWDVAAPGKPVHDLAFAAWNFIPLVDVDANPPAECARKLRLMAEAYEQVEVEHGEAGRIEAGEILDAVIPRIERALHTIRTGAANGDTGLQNLVDRGDMEFHEANLAKLRTRLPAITREL